MRIRSLFVYAAWTAILTAALPTGAAAQTAAAAPTTSDYDIVLAEPDFALTALPTTLRIPQGKFGFRMTHRFSRPIAGTCPDSGPKPDGCGGLGAFVENFFGFDSSSKVGLEVRYGLLPGTQVSVQRSNDRAIQFAGQHRLLTQSDATPVTVDVLGAIEGQNNFRETHTMTIGAIVSYAETDRGALYAHPILLFNSNPAPDTEIDDNHTVMLGLGGRLRLGSTDMYLVAEAAPRLAGYKPNVDHIAFGFEKRSGGHMFQLTVANAFGSTLRQVAMGGPGNGDWFVGFTLSRRFY
jgi:hypothetical protein